MGGELDSGRRARRGHGAVRQSRVPAARGRAPQRPRAGGRAPADAHRRAASGPCEGLGLGASHVRRSRAQSSRVSRGVGRGRGRRHEDHERERLSAVAASHWGRGSRSHRRARVARRVEMTTVLTPANQLTLLRMLLIPAFVILLLYGHLGWALVVFVTAGITDALDGLIARWSGQKTTVGAWLDPMADKLLLVTTFIALTLPWLGLMNPFPV